MSYQPQDAYPPVMSGHDRQPPHDEWTPPAKGKAVPILIAVVIMLILAVAGLAFMLLRGGETGATPAASVTSGGLFTQVQDGCKVVAGYRVEDGGQTLTITVGGQYMNADTATCVFDHLGTPAAVREHIDSTRALDGQQTDSWPGYTARWTYLPDDGLQMTIRAV